MKKLLLFALIAVGLGVFTSCSKDDDSNIGDTDLLLGTWTLSGLELNEKYVSESDRNYWLAEYGENWLEDYEKHYLDENRGATVTFYDNRKIISSDEIKYDDDQPDNEWEWKDIKKGIIETTNYVQNGGDGNVNFYESYKETSTVLELTKNTLIVSSITENGTTLKVTYTKR
jgi:hypothetical protein